MRYLHCILNSSRNTISQSRTLKSNTVLYSTSANLFRRPDLLIPPKERSWRSFARESTMAGEEGMKVKPSEEVLAIVDEISGLTLLEVADLTEVLRKKLDVKEMPVMAMMMPGMGFGGGGDGKGGGKGGGGGLNVEEKKEKTAFDLKLEGFEAAAKIKIIKEVRTFTDLGLKEAKDLVEKAPTLLKKGVPKEEAEKIIAKMKELGANVVME